MEPYTKHQGQNYIPDVKQDRYGNAQGSQYDLARDGSFKDEIVVVFRYISRDYDELTFYEVIESLSQKGFIVKVYNSSKEKPLSVDFIMDACKSASQVWIVSGTQSKMDSKTLEFFINWFRSGRGLYLWGDNDPYFVEANQLASALFNCILSGNIKGDKTIGVSDGASPGVIKGHLLSTGIQSIYEGITLSYLTNAVGAGLKPIIIGSDGQVIAACYEEDGCRAVIDGGFTRLYSDRWDTAGTARYVKNAAVWLANYERFHKETKKTSSILVKPMKEDKIVPKVKKMK